MSPAANTFGKAERIVSRRLIESLFEKGNSQSATAFPLKVVYRLVEAQSGDMPAQILISVPKKRFKHAVDRNRVKRQIREAYRRHKQLLWTSTPEGQQTQAAFIWLSDRHYTSAEVERRIVKLLIKIAERS